MKFLTNRKQKVCLFATDGQPIYSDEAEVMSRVLQGTVLGPTLFLIYVTDIFNHIDNGMHLFADAVKNSLVLHTPKASSMTQMSYETGPKTGFSNST